MSSHFRDLGAAYPPANKNPHNEGTFSTVNYVKHSMDAVQSLLPCYRIFSKQYLQQYTT